MLINMESWICLYVLYCFLKAANIGRECRMQYTAVTNDFTRESLYSVMVKIVSITLSIQPHMYFVTHQHVW